MWRYKLLSLLFYWLTMVQEIVTDFWHQTDDDEFFFFYYKVKTVLFVSSGPKPCEACRQEEIYEEPISILNSNEVSYEVCIFFFFLPALFLHETSSSPPLCFTGNYVTTVWQSFPHYRLLQCNLLCLFAMIISGVHRILCSPTRYFQTMPQDEK